MLHGSETWPVKKEKELRLQRAEMRMIRWMYGVKITNRLSRSELRDRLGIDGIITVIQLHRLRWYGHVLRKEKNVWVKMHGFYLQAGKRKTWSEVIGKNCQTRQICKEDVMDSNKWEQLIKDV